MDGMMLVPPTSTHATNQDWSGLYPDGDFEKSVNAGPTKKHIDDLPPAKEGFIAEYQQLRDEGKELVKLVMLVCTGKKMVLRI